MEANREYINQLIGIIEDQKLIIEKQANQLKEQELKIIKLEKKVDAYHIAYESLLVEVKELRIKVLEIDDLKTENKELRKENKKLKLEIKKLKNQKSKNSNNSSKPPSSNSFNSRHRNSNNKSDKKVGGQEGHKGSTLNRLEEADEELIHSPDFCTGCDIDLSEIELNDKNDSYRQEIDIIVTKHVRNHHIGSKVCPKCGKLIYGKYPVNIKSNVQYGNTIKSFSSYLLINQLIPYDRLSKLFSNLFNIPLSAGSLYNFNLKLSNGTTDILENIKENLLNSSLIHADETGLYCENKRYWGYVFSTSRFTYFDINKSRSKAALDEIGILNNYIGNLETDFYAMYRKYPNIKNYFCNAHLARELTYLHEIEGKYWAKRFMDSLFKLKNLDRTKSNFIKEKDNLISLLKSIIKNNLEIETRLQEENLRNLEEERIKKKLKKKIGKKAQTPAKNLLDRLDKYLDGYLGFVNKADIPFTNNQGERDFRFIKVQQKISGTFRTKEGAKNFLKIASVISTFKKQKLNVLECLQALLLGKTIAFEYQ